MRALGVSESLLASTTDDGKQYGCVLEVEEGVGRYQPPIEGST